MIRHVAVLLSGNAISQLVNVLTILVVVTNYFSPAEFGTYAVLMSYVGILASVACLRYELAIVSEERRLAADNMVFVAAGIATLFSAAVFVVFQGIVAVFGDAILLGSTAALLAALIWLKALDQICASILYRNEAYITYSMLKLLQALVLLAGFAISGVAGWASHGLIWSTLLAYAAFAIAGIFLVRKYLSRVGIRRRRLIVLAHKNSDFVKYNTPHALMDNFLSNGLNIVLVGLAGPVIVGYFSYLQRVLKAPLGLVISAISQVVFRFCAKNKQNSDMVIRKLRQVMVIVLLAIAIALLAIVLVYLFFDKLVFLKEWSGLQEYLIAFAVWMLMPFIFSPFSTLPVVYERQKQFFFLATSFNALSLVTLAGLIELSSVNAAFWSVGLASVVYYVAMTSWLFRIAGRAPAT